jgi:hypothetical protein
MEGSIKVELNVTRLKQWTGFLWFVTGTSGGFFVNKFLCLGFTKYWEIPEFLSNC